MELVDFLVLLNKRELKLQFKIIPCEVLSVLNLYVNFSIFYDSNSTNECTETVIFFA